VLNPASLRLLLVEDNPADVVLTRMTLDSARAPDCSYSLTVLGDGERAIAYLADEKNPRPDVLILDLNLPRIDGFEVLERLRNTPNYQDLAVIVFSSSQKTADEQRAKALGVRAYLHKPGSLPGYEELVHVARSIGRSVGSRKRSE
jgi:CheY-like chemotaxis protein